MREPVHAIEQIEQTAAWGALMNAQVVADGDVSRILAWPAEVARQTPGMKIFLLSDADQRAHRQIFDNQTHGLCYLIRRLTVATTFRDLSNAALLVIACVIAAAAFDVVAQPASGTLGTMPRQMFSHEERVEFCAQMRSAATVEERQAIAQHMHDTTVARAKEQGVQLPPDMQNGAPMTGHGAANTGTGMRGNMAGTGCAPDAGNTSGRVASPAAALPAKQYRGIDYVTGGVGEDEAAALRAVASRYSMRARFTSSSGEFLSGVKVLLSQVNGALVFVATTDGPYLYAQIPPGHYRLSAVSDGVERARDISISSRGGVSVALTWPMGGPGSPN